MATRYYKPAMDDIEFETMDVHELRTLRLFEAIEQKRSSSQRDLAKTLGISLGLVNSFMRRLTKKGYFKVTHLPRNRIRYILTPKGAAEKTRLTYAYIKLSCQFYRNARSKIRKHLNNLENRNVKSVAFFGTGDLAEIAYLSLQETELQFVGIGDSIGNGDSFFGHAVIGFKALGLLNFDVVLITNDQGDGGGYRNLLSVGIHPDKIIML